MIVFKNITFICLPKNSQQSDGSLSEIRRNSQKSDYLNVAPTFFIKPTLIQEASSIFSHHQNANLNLLNQLPVFFIL